MLRHKTFLIILLLINVLSVSLVTVVKSRHLADLVTNHAIRRSSQSAESGSLFLGELCKTIITDVIMKDRARAYSAGIYRTLSSEARTSYADGGPAVGSVIDLESVSAGNFLPFLRNTQIKGILTIRTDITMGSGNMAEKFTMSSEISVQGLFIASKSFHVDLKDKPLHITLKGVYDRKQDRLDIEFLKTRLSQLKPWVLQGTVNNILSGDPAVNLEAGGEIPFHEIKEIITGPEVKWFDGIDFEALGSMSLTVSGNLKSPSVQGVVMVQGKKFKRKNTLIRSYEIKLPVRYQKNMLIVKGAMINAKECMYSDVNTKEKVHYRIDNVKILIPYLEYRDSMMTSDIIQVSADKADMTVNDRGYYEEKGIALKGIMHGDFNGQWMKFSDLSFNTDFIKNVSGDIYISLDKPVTIEADVNYDGLNIHELLQKIPNALAKDKGLSAHGTGSLHSSLKIALPENSDYQVSGEARVSLREAGFSFSDETMIGEGISGTVSGSFAFPIPFNSIDFTFHTESTGFELLMGKFYGNFTDRILRFSAKGRYARSGESLTLSRSEIELSDTGSIVISGDISGVTKSPFFDVEIDMVHLSNREGYNFFVRETFQEQFPFLSQLDISGESTLKLSVKGSMERFTASGNIVISDMNIQGKSPDRFIQGLNISLPLYISYPEAHHREEKKRFGSLKVKDLSWALLRIRDIEVFPSVWDNAILFKKDIQLPLFGGKITLKNISYSEILTPERKLHLASDIDNIDLGEVTRTLDLPRFTGSLSGTIPNVTFAGNRLLTEGEIYLELFDGSIRLSDLSMNRVFSPIPSLKCNIEAEDIDLGKLTSTFDFGNISGIIKGSVEDLVIVRGQAQSFKASMESIRKKGISQKISVEALKKISILGSGSSASVLDMGIYQFFKEYRYAKLGFKAFLRNDNLILLGVESRENRGYLVKGGLLPPRVDVINYNQNISFQEMVKRLKRIKQVK